MPQPRPVTSFHPSVEHLEGREVPATLYGLTGDNQLIRFDSATPGTVQATVNLGSGLRAGDLEQVVGIDFRPRTGQLYALAVTPTPFGTGRDARLLVVDPTTGAATQVGAGFTMPTTVATVRFGVGFDPTTDLLRVVGSNNLNLRIDPSTGAIVGTDALLTPFGQGVREIAYDRNFDGHLGANGTTLFALSPASARLLTLGGVNQSPGANTGVLTPFGPLNTPIDPTSTVGFDIPTSGSAGGYGFAAFDGDPTAAVNTQLYQIGLGGNSTLIPGAAISLGTIGTGAALIGLAAAPDSRFAVAGTTDTVEVRDGATGDLIRTLTPYPGFTGEIRVAVADVNRDGVPDVITGAGAGGGSHVKVFDGVSGVVMYSFFAYGPGFTGGVFVAGGDVDGDGYADVITGAGATGAPHVRAFSGKTGGEILSFFAYDAGFTGGVRVASADVTADGFAEVITAAGAGGAPHVKVFDGRTAAEQLSFFAYDAGFGGGVYVAAGDVNGDGVADIITGAGGAPHVKAFDATTGAAVASFFAFESTFTGGARVGVGDRNADGRFEILVTPGPGRDIAVRAFDATSGGQVNELTGVLSGTAGAFVAGALG